MHSSIVSHFGREVRSRIPNWNYRGFKERKMYLSAISDLKVLTCSFLWRFSKALSCPVGFFRSPVWEECLTHIMISWPIILWNSVSTHSIYLPKVNSQCDSLIQAVSNFQYLTFLPKRFISSSFIIPTVQKKNRCVGKINYLPLHTEKVSD